MGASIHAFIEYDHTLLFYPDNTAPPFTTVPEVIDLTSFTLFRSGKDYRFFAAISGMRNHSEKAPLYALRGLPSPINWQTAQGLDELYGPDYPVQSWLTFTEIKTALAHMGLTADDLSLETNVVLEMMWYLTKQLGTDRVRLVFAIE